MTKKKRVGIYGGTFNPPHIGHIGAVKAFFKFVALDRVLIIPTYLPPHKDYSSDVDATTRLEMCRIAFADFDFAEVSDLEIKRGGKSYTYETLEELSSSDTELYFLCGTDMFLSMDSWKNPSRIFELATICYIRRESQEVNDRLVLEKAQEYEEKFGAKIIAVPTNPIDISSLKIREAILTGKNAEKYLTEKTVDFIKKEELYK